MKALLEKCREVEMSSGKNIKITFIGDITCDSPLLEAYRNDSRPDFFSGVFSQTRPLLEDSDLVVANFETVCAGSSNNYKTEFLLYNTPDDIVSAMRDAGIGFVTTANNHCLDQGVAGLKRTIDVLDKNGIAHTGTFKSPEDRKTEKQIITLGGVRIAILSYTYGTNESNTGIVLDETNDYLVGLLRKQADAAKQRKGLKSFLAKTLSAKQRRMLQRVVNRAKLRMGISYFKPFTDSAAETDNPENPYLIKVKKEIEDAKKIADLVAVCPHMGGQFNTEPGTYSEFLVDYLSNCGADIIAGNHPHVVQKATVKDGCAAAYSLGGFNLSVSADYIVHDSLPEYSMALHVYIDRESKTIEKETFSILKIIEDDCHRITVYPVDKLSAELITDKTKSDITTVYNRITQKTESLVDICKEYPL